MAALTNFSAEDWEATLVACHFHPQKIQALIRLRDDMHDYELHVRRRKWVDPYHKVPDKPDVTRRMIEIIGDDEPIQDDSVPSAYIRREPRQPSCNESPLDAACRLSSIDAEMIRRSLE